MLPQNFARPQGVLQAGSDLLSGERPQIFLRGSHDDNSAD